MVRWRAIKARDHVFGQEIEEKVPSETDLDGSESPGERLGAVEKGHIDTESPSRAQACQPSACDTP